MKLFVTGVTGYIGSHIAQALIDRGHQVTGLVRDLEKIRGTKIPGVDYVEGDLSDTAMILDHVRKSDGIVHAAAANSDSFNKTNGTFVTAVLEELGGSGKPFVMQGGTMVFGDTGDTPLDDAKGNLPYHNPSQMDGRVALEKQVLGSAEKGVRPIIGYGAYVFGGSSAMIPQLMKKAIGDLGYSPYVGKGDNRWSSVHIEDWAQLFALAIENKEAKGPFVAASNSYTLKEIAQILDDVTDESKEVKSIDIDGKRDLWDFFTEPLANMNQQFASGKGKKVLGWKPTRTDLRSNL